MTLELSQNAASKSSTLIVQGATLKDTIESSIAAASGSFTLTDYMLQEERNDLTQEKTNSGKGKLNSTFIGVQSASKYRPPTPSRPAAPMTIPIQVC